MEDKNKDKSAGLSNAGTMAAGISTAAITGSIGSVVAGMAQFGNSAVEQARIKTELMIEQIPAKLLKEAEESSKARIQSKASLVELYKLQGNSSQTANLRAEYDYIKQLEEIAADQAKFVENAGQPMAENLRANLNLYESEAGKWKSATILEKPLIGFKNAGVSTKLGIVATAAALGIGTSWVLHAKGDSDRKTSFEEQVRSRARAPSATLG